MKKDYFNRTQKLVTVIIDATVFVVGIFLSFWMRFGMVIPQRNLDDGKAALTASVIAFLIINVLSGVYVLYNKTLLDIGIITVVDQVMVTIVIMALTFFGRWFAFPRSVLLINLVVGIVLLLVWRSVEVVAYRHLRGAKRVMLLGPPEMLNRAVMNYMANKATRHRLTHVVRGHYLEQIRSHLSLIHI